MDLIFIRCTLHEKVRCMSFVRKFFEVPWEFLDGRWRLDIQERGLYTVMEGIPKLWYQTIESYMKNRVYISEYGIDWDSEPYAYRDGDQVVTGVRFSMDHDIYTHAIKNAEQTRTHGSTSHCPRRTPVQ